MLFEIHAEKNANDKAIFYYDNERRNKSTSVHLSELNICKWEVPIAHMVSHCPDADADRDLSLSKAAGFIILLDFLWHA